MSLNIDTALDIAERAAADAYNNGADLQDILRAALEGVGPWIAAETLRESARYINTYAKVAYEQGLDDEARGYFVARGILTDRADALTPATEKLADADRRRMGLTTPPRPADHNPVA